MSRLARLYLLAAISGVGCLTLLVLAGRLEQSAHEEWGRVASVLGVACLLAFLAVMHLSTRERIVARRRFLEEHPERVGPYGWKYLLRTSPFVAIVVVSAVYGILEHRAVYVVYGVLGTAAFGWVIARRWSPPSS